MPASTTIVLICTGLGHQNRGFEQYIAALAGKLQASGQFPGLEVWSGAKWPNGQVKASVFPLLKRTSPMLRNTGKAFVAEQMSFFMAIIPALLRQKPSLIYLGEYRLYCWLYKLRKALGLSYKLCLYTGGQAIPGASVFDSPRDFVHHISSIYLPQCQHIPAARQTVLPHFIQDDFQYNASKQRELLTKAAGKPIVLSVGLLDKTVKRMHLLIEALSELEQPVFPILLGERSADTPALEALLLEKFGKEGYIMATLPHPQLGDYYRAASLFVLCSPKESFGLAMAEALHHGLPVICHDFEEARMVFGNSIHFTDATNPGRLARDISLFLTRNPQTTHPQLLTPNPPTTNHQPPTTPTPFTWQNLGEKYLGMFSKLVEG